MNMNDTMNNKRLENLAGVFDSFSSVTAPPAYILDVETKEMLYVSRYPMFIAGYTAAEAKAKGKNLICVNRYISGDTDGATGGRRAS